jgi:membrane protease YdiL (CAAX protease family)
MPIVTLEELQRRTQTGTPDSPLPETVLNPAGTVPRPPLPRWAAILQAITVCGIPTQLALLPVIWFGLGIRPFDDQGLSLEFFAIASLLDTAVIAVLIRVFLDLSRETSTSVFIGRRPVAGEILRGLLLVPLVFIGVAGLVLGLRWIAPWLQTVAQSPLEDFMRTPLEAAIFLVVVVLAGGVREELQRAFILHRCEQALGHIGWGLAIFSITFGLLHLDQGVDVAMAIGALGLFWGVIYIRRRSAVLAMVNHAGFNALQVVQVMLTRL